MVAFLTFLSAYSQDKVEATDNKQVTVYLKDGTRLVGTFDRLTSDTLYFNHPVLGYQKVPQSQIDRFDFGNPDQEAVPQGYEGFVQVETESFYRKYGFGKLPHNRYSFTPNGFGPPKGESYFRSTMLVYNTLDFGLTDHFSFNFGTVGIVYPALTLKYRSKLSERVSIGLTGGFVMLPGGTLDENSTSTFDVAGYGSAGLSFGTSESNVSFGIGAIAADGNVAPIYFLGGNHDISTAVSLSGEIAYINAGFIQGQRDVFIPMIMPKVYSKRSMWGLGISLPMSYDGVSESWEDVMFMPLILYSRKLGPIAP